MDSGHIITDDIVIDYRNPDKDDALHFLTHVDVRPNQPLKSLSEYISPTAKRILTSHYNAWFLKANFNVTNCEGYKLNTKIKVIFKGVRYICTFIDSKYSVGSISVLIWGPFGTCLYTGNFCYYPQYLNSYFLALVVDRKKLLNTVYLDSTYYEQKSEFAGVQDNLETVISIIKSSPSKKIYIHAEKLTLDPIIADLASQLEENVYVDPSRMQTMQLLGYDKHFTTDITRTRVIVSKGFLQKRGSQEILIIFKRHSEPTFEFEPFSFNKKKNIFTFHFYCHSNHKECCHLINILKPEKLIPINSSSIDRSKITIAPMLNSLGKKKSFSISSSFKSIPFNFIPKPVQADLKEFNVKEENSPFAKKENPSFVKIENSFSLKKFETKRDFEKPALDSMINPSEKSLNSAFKINQTNMTKPNTCLPDDVQKNDNNELVISATFSLNNQDSLDIFASSNLVGATGSPCIKTYSNNRDKPFSPFTKKISSGEHNLVQSGPKSTSCISSQKLLQEGLLKIRKVSEINLLSESKNIVSASKETIKCETEPNVNIISPEEFDNESGVQKDIENCIKKDSSLLLPTKVWEKPKSILLSKPKISSPCVENLKQTDINGSCKIDKSSLPSESDTRKNDKPQPSIKIPLWSNRPLYIYEDKRIIPAKKQISLLNKNIKNNADALTPLNDLPKEKDVQPMKLRECKVIKHSSLLKVSRVTEPTNLKRILENQRESPDVINKTVRILQTVPVPMENVKQISYPKGSIAAFSIKKNKSSSGNTSTLPNLILKNSNNNRILIPIDVANNSEKGDIIAKTHLKVITNSPEIITYPPEIITNSPEIITNPPETITNSPEIRTKSPEITTSSPEITIESPEITTNSPEITTSSTEIRTMSPEITSNCPGITTNFSEITKEGIEKRSSPKEIDLPKEIEENSYCNQDFATISIPENSEEADMFENSVLSLIKQIESYNKTINRDKTNNHGKTINHDKTINHGEAVNHDKNINHNKTINQSKLTKQTSETPVEGSQNKLISDSSANITSQSSANFSKKNISSSNQASASNLSEGNTEVNPILMLSSSKDSDSNHSFQDNGNCEEPKQLRKRIEHNEENTTSMHSNENSDFCRTRKRKLNSNKSDFHKTKRLLRSSEIDDNSSISEHSDSQSSRLLTPLPDNLQKTENVDDILQKKFGITPCRVILNRKDITRRHFFSPNHGAYVPKFYGFTSIDMRRTRRHHYFLRICNKFFTK